MRQALVSHSLHTDQSEFAAAILDPTRSIPLGLVGPDGETDARRFAVYRNNVVVGLCETLKAAYPVVCRIVGEEFFMATSRIYISHEPPVSPIMLDYGEGFPDFIGSFEPVSELPYLGDVARVERAWVEAYYASDIESLEPEALAAVDREKLASLILELHPSIRIVRSAFPALSIWQTNTSESTPTPIDLGVGGEDALIFRPGADVEVRSLPPGGAAFLLGLIGGLSIVEATREASAADRRFDLAGNLAGLISMRGIVGYRFQTAYCCEST